MSSYLMNSSDLIIFCIQLSDDWWLFVVRLYRLNWQLYWHEILLDKTKRNILAFTDIVWHKRSLKYSNLFPDVNIYSSIIHIDSKILSNACRTTLASKIQYIHVYPGDVHVQDIYSSSWNVWRASIDSLFTFIMYAGQSEKERKLWEAESDWIIIVRDPAGLLTPACGCFWRFLH